MGGNPRWIGAGLVALSALSFGAMAIFARFAFAGGVDVTALLFLRFLIAGGLMAVAMVVSRRPWPTGRNALTLVLMGGVGYVAQALCFFRLCHRCLWNRTPCNLSEYTVLLQSGGWR